MTATEATAHVGQDLTPTDFDNLAARWIDPATAKAAMLRRVDSSTGMQIVGRKKGNYAGVVIPYVRPGDGAVVHHRLRRDVPDLEIVAGNKHKESAKYLGPPERGNRLYFPPNCTPAQLADATLPVVVCEGEFKVLAAWRLANHETASPRFLPVGVGGVYGWKGTTGKLTGPNGERLDEKGPIPDLDLIEWKGRRVSIAFDADFATKDQVKAARWQLSRELRSRGAEVGFLEWKPTEGKGLDDHLAAVGPERALDEIGGVDFNRISGWRAHLLVSESGRPKALLENAACAIERAPEFEGVLAFDEFRLRTVALRPAPWGRPLTGGFWTESDDIEVTRWLQRERIEVSKETAGLAVQLVAARTRIHEVRDYLNSLEWDGRVRCDSWLLDYCGVPSTDAEPNIYAMAVGRAWLISAIARVMQPGCKVDHTLVLEGRQGIGKSKALAALGGKWFTDHLPPDLNSKDAALSLAGVWIVELSELNALSRHEQSAVKAYLTRQCDRYRPPYARRTEDAPRMCVFAGSTNQSEWSSDETGGRRYWPVECRGTIDDIGLARDRDQIWAEAAERYRQGQIWWIDDSDILEDAQEEQAARFTPDPWQEGIRDYLELFQTTTIPEILRSHLKLDESATTQQHYNRVSRCLKSLRWEKCRLPETVIDGKRTRLRGYRRSS